MVLSQVVRESLTELSLLSQPPKEGREQARQVSGAKPRDGNMPALFREELARQCSRNGGGREGW